MSTLLNSHRRFQDIQKSENNRLSVKKLPQVLCSGWWYIQPELMTSLPPRLSREESDHSRSNWQHRVCHHIMTDWVRCPTTSAQRYMRVENTLLADCTCSVLPWQKNARVHCTCRKQRVRTSVAQWFQLAESGHALQTKSCPSSVSSQTCKHREKQQRQMRNDISLSRLEFYAPLILSVFADNFAPLPPKALQGCWTTC